MDASYGGLGDLPLQVVIDTVPHPLVVHKAESLGGGACFAVNVAAAKRSHGIFRNQLTLDTQFIWTR